MAFLKVLPITLFRYALEGPGKKLDLVQDIRIGLTIEGWVPTKDHLGRHHVGKAIWRASSNRG